MNKLPIKKLWKLITPDFDTGDLLWNYRQADKGWSKKYAGTDALHSVHKDGYYHGHIGKKLFLAHRVIWAMHYGEWPKQEIDHKDGNRKNNKISNLREASTLQNGQNKKTPINNSSGVCGVSLRAKNRKWVARIKVNQKEIYLGDFVRKSDAIEARRVAEVHYGFHENHGRLS